MLYKTKENLGVYIHIPFCQSKCNYCDFISYQGREECTDKYIKCLLREIELTAGKCSGYKIDTVYLGGGTPSHVDEKYILSILEKCYSCFDMANCTEISIESNPGTIQRCNLKAYKDAGINRLSIGMQTHQDKILKVLGRIHTFREFVEGYMVAREIGFNNISVDLIFGLPNQSVSDWSTTLKETIAIQPEHVSCYSLKIEKGTPFYKLYVESVHTKISISENLPSEDDERKMYHMAVSMLASQGYYQYEISNFCKPEFESRHNLKYWKCHPYVGLGVGAHSYFEGKRCSNQPCIEDYMNSIINNDKPLEFECIEITRDQSMSEFVILGLRLIGGVSKHDFVDRYGNEIEGFFKPQINKLVGLGLLINDSNCIRLTTRGLDVANYAMSEFIV